MEIATPIGVLLGFIAVIGSFVMEGGSPTAMIHPTAMGLVFGGTFGAVLASNRTTDLKGVFKAGLSTIKPGKKADPTAMVNELMTYADVARREGLLALEEKAKEASDPFLRRALELVADGTDSEELAESLESEIDGLRERHSIAVKFFADMGAFAPTLGIIGTVLGLVHALEGITDPAGLGKAISSAFIATLWGVMSANLMWLPVSNKLRRISATEASMRRLIMHGVLAIQTGISGRAVGERLKSHLAPSLRGRVGGKDTKDAKEKAA